MRVQTGLVAHKVLFVPYSAIKSIDPGEIYRNLDKDLLARHYSEPPRAKTIVRGRGASLAVTSGNDGGPEVVNRVDLAQMRQDLVRGMAIYDSNGHWVGIDGIDEHAGYLLARRSRFSQQDFFTPFAAIGTIDREFETAYGLDDRRDLPRHTQGGSAQRARPAAARRRAAHRPHGGA